jgi:hypothetical protein
MVGVSVRYAHQCRMLISCGVGVKGVVTQVMSTMQARARCGNVGAGMWAPGRAALRLEYNRDHGAGMWVRAGPVDSM